MAERESRYRRSPRRSPDERRGHRMEDKRRRRRDSSEDARTRNRRERSRSPQSRRLVCFNWSSGASGCDIWPLHVEYKLNCTLKLWAEFCVLMSVDYAWTYWSELNYCAWFVLSVSSLPCLSWSAVAMRVLTLFLRFWCCTLAVAAHRRNSGLGISHALNYPRTYNLHEIFKCAHLKLAASRHVHTHNFCKCCHASVGLALARPIRKGLPTKVIAGCMPFHKHTNNTITLFPSCD